MCVKKYYLVETNVMFWDTPVSMQEYCWILFLHYEFMFYFSSQIFAYGPVLLVPIQRSPSTVRVLSFRSPRCAGDSRYEGT